MFFIPRGTFQCHDKPAACSIISYVSLVLSFAFYSSAEYPINSFSHEITSFQMYNNGITSFQVYDNHFFQDKIIKYGIFCCLVLQNGMFFPLRIQCLRISCLYYFPDFPPSIL